VSRRAIRQGWLVSAALLGLGFGAATAFGQARMPAGTGTAPAPAGVITLADALRMARANSPALQAALAATGAAHAARIQARSGLLPNLSLNNQFLYTQPNGTPTGVYIANNGTHEYINQADVHQTIGVAQAAGYRSAAAVEDVARAQAEIAARGLVYTVVQAYDALVVAQRKYATAKQAGQDAQRFLTITRDREHGGEAAHADVIKAEIQLQQSQRNLSEAALTEGAARNELAILIFPDYRTRYQVADDLRTPAALPPFATVQAQAAKHNPSVAAAMAALRQADQNVWVARGAIIPSLGLDYYYGIDANQFATTFDGIRNLGSSVLATVNVPLWNWGATEAQIAAAHLQVRQARVELSFQQRQLLADLHSFYAEAQTARAELDSLKRSVDLAAESLRLATLRYQAGEALVLEVVDAQNTLVLARNAYDDGQARYELALANLQTLTGTL